MRGEDMGGEDMGEEDMRWEDMPKNGGPSTTNQCGSMHALIHKLKKQELKRHLENSGGNWVLLSNLFLFTNYTVHVFINLLSDCVYPYIWKIDIIKKHYFKYSCIC